MEFTLKIQSLYGAVILMVLEGNWVTLWVQYKSLADILQANGT